MLKWYLQDPTFFLLPLPQSWLYSRCGSLCPWQISPASQPTPLQSFRLVKPSVLTTQKNSVRAPPTAGYPRGNPSLCREEPGALTGQGCPAPEREALEQDAGALCSLHRPRQCPRMGRGRSCTAVAGGGTRAGTDRAQNTGNRKCWIETMKQQMGQRSDIQAPDLVEKLSGSPRGRRDPGNPPHTHTGVPATHASGGEQSSGKMSVPGRAGWGRGGGTRREGQANSLSRRACTQGLWLGRPEDGAKSASGGFSLSSFPLSFLFN